MSVYVSDTHPYEYVPNTSVLYLTEYVSDTHLYEYVPDTSIVCLCTSAILTRMNTTGYIHIISDCVRQQHSLV